MNKQGWTYKKLGEVAQSDLGKTLNSKKDIGDLYPYLCAINVLWDKIDTSTLKETRFEESELERYSVKKGDLLICEGGEIGRAAIWDKEKPILYQNALHRVRFKGEVVPRFCLIYLKSLKEKGILDTSYGKGVTIKHLVKTALLSIPIPIPPVAEQERIVAELDLLSSIIEKKKAQLKELDQLAQSIFYTMFGDPITNPKGWEKSSLNKMGLLARGVSKHRPRNAPELLGGTMPLIQTGDVANADFYIRDYTSTYSELGVSQSKIWKAGTLCITIAATIGKCAILNFDACFPDSVVGFTVNDKVCRNEYVFFIFKCLQSILEENAPSVAQKNINLKVLNELDVPLPPLPLQQEFAEKVEAIEKQKALIQQSIDEVQTLFDSRMDYWFG